jgi:hypothetical protein
LGFADASLFQIKQLLIAKIHAVFENENKTEHTILKTIPEAVEKNREIIRELHNRIIFSSHQTASLILIFYNKF